MGAQGSNGEQMGADGRILSKWVQMRAEYLDGSRWEQMRADKSKWEQIGVNGSKW